MRSLLMASAALILTGGFALAQTATSAPAPTGAPNAAQTTQGGSPGSMAPAKTATGQASAAPAAPAATSTASSSPAPTGAPNAAPASPGSSPGNMAPAASASTAAPAANQGATNQAATNNAPSETPVMHHHAMAMAGLPANASARTYLHIAKMDIRNHEVARADDALSHAETRMLTRAVPASASALADNSPGVTAIENARTALHSGNYAEANADVDTAMQSVHGGMGETGMGNGSAVMGNGAMGGGMSGANASQ